MRLPKLNSPDKLVNINVEKYKISWKKAPSKGQQILQDFLYPYCKGRIVCAEVRIPSSLLRLDIVNFSSRWILEYSPETHHNKFNKFFHKSKSGLLKSIQTDFRKLEYAKMAGFKFIEITEEDLPNLSYQWFVEKFGVYL